MFWAFMWVLTVALGYFTGQESAEYVVTESVITEANARCSLNMDLRSITVTRTGRMATCTNGATFILREKP